MEISVQDLDYRQWGKPRLVSRALSVMEINGHLCEPTGRRFLEALHGWQ